MGFNVVLIFAGPIQLPLHSPPHSRLFETTETPFIKCSLSTFDRWGPEFYTLGSVNIG